MKTSLSRRVLLTGALATTAAVITRTGWADGHGHADRVKETDPTAQALGYVEDASTVDAAAYPKWTDQQLCSNCVLYSEGDGEWGKCGAFPGKLVAADGWCNAWGPK